MNKTLKIIGNKKSAFVVEPLIIIICFIVFAFVGLIFYILFGLAGKVAVYDMGIGSDTPTNADYLLLSYLKTPVEVDGMSMSMADFIVSSIPDGTYNEKNNDIYKGQLKNYFKPENCLTITIKSDGINLKSIVPVAGFANEMCHNKRISSIAMLPSQKENKAYSAELEYYVDDPGLIIY